MAPRGCPLASKPPLGLTTYFPPYYRTAGSDTAYRIKLHSAHRIVPAVDHLMGLSGSAEPERVIHQQLCLMFNIFSMHAWEI